MGSFIQKFWAALTGDQKSTVHNPVLRAPRQPQRAQPNGSETFSSVDEWIAHRRTHYSDRGASSSDIEREAERFNKELMGVRGPLIDWLLAPPSLVPEGAWSSLIGWKSAKLQSRWTKVMTEAPHPPGTNDTQVLLKCSLRTSAWVPHPYAPPTWCCKDFVDFSRYVFPNREAFVLAQTWHRENSQVLTQRLSERVRPLEANIGASLFIHDRDYAWIAVSMPVSSELIRFDVTWKGETTLVQTVRTAHPDAIREYSPDWLNGQRLDVFIPSLRLALEYQGEQHYHPVEFFGGQKAIDATRLRDARKREACEAAGVVLIEWPHWRTVTPEAVRHAIRDALGNQAT